MSLSSELIDQLVKVTQNTEPRDKDNTSYGTVVIMGSKKYVKIDGSDLMTPVSSTVAVENGDRVIVTIKSHSATITGNTSSPAASDKKVNELGTKISDFEIVIADKVSAKELDVQIGRIDDLTADNATIKESLTANKASIDDLTAKNAEITGTLEANKAKIDDLDAKKLDAEVADIKYASVDRLDATDADLRNLKSDYAQFEKTTTGELEATNAKIDGLDTKYANVDFSNIGKAAIEQFYATSGIIKDLVVGDQTITGELVGITISGDLIKGDTIVADKLVIKGSDGLYYKLNTDGVTTEKEQTEYNSLNGQIIQAKSITATKIDVKDLVAFGATIGGFNIGQDSIFSGVKETVDNESRGIYMDKNGQIAIGDVNNYIKYFKDTDGRYRLKISAASLEFNASGDSGEESKDLETVIKDINDKVDGISETNKGIGSITNYYLATSESSGVTTETAGWTTKIQNVSSSKKYLWNYEVTKYTDDTIANTTEPCIIGMYSEVGATGNGIQKITEYYALSALKDSVPTIWSENVPNLTATNKYMWNYEEILYTNGGTELTKKRIIGVYGDTGKDGAKGEDGYSPTATVSKNGDTTTITIVDKTGTHTQTVKDGTNGTPGKDGINGKTTYFHVKYSNDGGKTFTSNSGETVGSYIGTCTNYTEADPTTVGSYVWAKIKGEKGETGNNGKSIGSVVNYYLATSASSGVSTSTSGWTTTVQNVTLEKKYLWNYEVVKYSDGTVASTTSPCIIGTYGDTGKTGATGKNALQVLKQWNGTYTTIGQEVNCPTDRFNRTPVAGDIFTNVDASSNLGTWQITNVADGYAYFKMVSYVSAKGATGATGNGIKSIKEHYAVSTSNTVTPTSWLDDVPVTNTVNKYLWNYETITYTNGTSVDSKKRVIGVYGDTGKDGAKGEKGDDFRWNLVKCSAMTNGTRLVYDGIEGMNDINTKVYENDGFHIITPSSGNRNNGIGFVYNDFSTLGIKPGDTLTFSCDVKGTSDTNKPFIRLHFQASGTTWYDSGHLESLDGQFTPTADFKRVSVTYTLPDKDVYKSKRMWLAIHGNYASDLYIRNIKLELGSPATPWSPHPYDLVGADGKGIKSTAVTYQASTSGTVIPTGTWQTTVPATSASYPYLWTRTIITYTDDTTSTSYAVGSTLEGVSVGGRNLARKTSNEYCAAFNSFNGGDNICPSLAHVYLKGLSVGDNVTVRLVYKYTNIVAVTGKTATAWIQGSGNITEWTSGAFWNSASIVLSGSGEKIIKYSFVITSDMIKNQYWNVNIRHDGIQSGSVQWKEFKVEKGNIATDWTPAPEDGIASVDVEYYLSTSATALSGGSWSTTAPTWVNGKYMWSRTVTTDGAGNKTYSPNQNGVCIAGAKGETGATGATGATGVAGKGVSSIIEQYYKSTSATALSGGSWGTTYPGWENGKYIWTRSVITYTDKTTTTTTAVCVTGTSGKDGINGTNLWINPLFESDKPQIGTRDTSIKAPNGSDVNLIDKRDNYNSSANFPVFPGHSYRITVHRKKKSGSINLSAGIWYIAQTSGHSFDTYVAETSTKNLSDGWQEAVYNITCPNGKSKGCVFFQLEKTSTTNTDAAWYVANIICTDITGLKGDKGDTGAKGATGPQGPKGDGLDIKDTRATNESPNWYFKNYPKTTVMEFKECNAIGLSNVGIYCNLQTIVLWGDSSGGYPRQTAKIEGTGKEYWRVGTSDTTWSSWIDPYGKSLEAAKTATNFMEFTSGAGLQIGDKTNGSWKGFRSRITSTAFEILNEAGTAVASYGRKLIQLGKDSVDAVIELCGGKGSIKHENVGVYGETKSTLTVNGVNLGLLADDSVIIRSEQVDSDNTTYTSQIYMTKGRIDIATFTELEDGTVISSNGVDIDDNIGIDIGVPGETETALSKARINGRSLLDFLHPVGSIYMSTNATNPTNLFGGTWVAWGAGRVPVGFNGSDGNFNSSEKTGGSKTINISHSHTVNSHKHIGATGYDENHYYSGVQWGSAVVPSHGYWWHARESGATYPIRLSYTSPESPGTNAQLSGSQSILQPYITCYMWKRTA